MMYIPNEYYYESALSEKVLLHTRSGLIQISELSDRKNITIISGDGGETIAAAVVPIGDHSTYKITLENGLTLRSTYNTPVRCVLPDGNESMVPVEHIHRKDIVSIPVDPRHTIRGGATDADLSTYLIGARRDVLPNELLSLPKETVSTLLMMLLVGDDQRTTVDMDDDNSIVLTHESSSSRAAYQLQQILLGYYGVATRREGTTVTLRDAELAKLVCKCDIVEYLCNAGKVSYDLSYDQLNSLLSLCEYKDERETRNYRVVEVESIGRTPTYGLKLQEDTTAVANGFVVGGLRGEI